MIEYHNPVMKMIDRNQSIEFRIKNLKNKKLT